MSDYWDLIDPFWEHIEIHRDASAFLASLEAAPPEVRALYCAHFCQSEICNGGFTQFFWNSTGVLAPEAVAGFTAIGQAKVAGIVGRAMAMLSQPYSRDRAARQRDLWALSSGSASRGAFEGCAPYRNVEAFAPLEHDFFLLLKEEGGGFKEAADRYAAESIAAQMPRLD